MLSPPSDTSPSSERVTSNVDSSHRRSHTPVKKPHEETMRRVASSPNSYSRRTKKYRQSKVSLTSFTPDLVCIGDPEDELTAQRTKSFVDYFIAHTLGGSEYENRPNKSEFRLTIDEIVVWAKSERHLSNLDDKTFENIIQFHFIPLPEFLDRCFFNKLECYAAARALMLRSDTFNKLARPFAFSERCYAEDEIIGRIAELFPDNLKRRRALAEKVYEKGFMQGNFTRASECLAPLYGLLNNIDVPLPKKTTGLMMPGTSIHNARTMYEYLVDGYTRSTGLSYVNRFCRYRAFIVSGGGGIESALGKSCDEYAHRLASILEHWCFDVEVLTQFTNDNLLETLCEELEDFAHLPPKYDGCLFYFVGHSDESIQETHDAVAGRVSEDLLKMFIIDSCQDDWKEGEQLSSLESIKPNVFILQTAPGSYEAKSDNAKAVLNKSPKKRVVSDEALAVPCFTKALVGTLERSRGCVKLRDVVAQATAAMNDESRANGTKERQSIDRGSTTSKSIFLFPESVTRVPVVPPVPSEIVNQQAHDGNQQHPPPQATDFAPGLADSSPSKHTAAAEAVNPDVLSSSPQLGAVSRLGDSPSGRHDACFFSNQIVDFPCQYNACIVVQMLSGETVLDFETPLGSF